MLASLIVISRIVASLLASFSNDPHGVNRDSVERRANLVRLVVVVGRIICGLDHKQLHRGRGLTQVAPSISCRHQIAEPLMHPSQLFILWRFPGSKSGQVVGRYDRAHRTGPAETETQMKIVRNLLAGLTQGGEGNSPDLRAAACNRVVLTDTVFQT